MFFKNFKIADTIRATFQIKDNKIVPRDVALPIGPNDKDENGNPLAIELKSIWFVPNKYGNVGGYTGKTIKLVWEGFKSCFDSGIWLPAKPWIGKTLWKNKK